MKEPQDGIEDPKMLVEYVSQDGKNANHNKNKDEEDTLLIRNKDNDGSDGTVTFGGVPYRISIASDSDATISNSQSNRGSSIFEA